MSQLRFCLQACFLFVAPVFCVGAETEWKVGLANVEITPQEPVMLAGYASRDRPFEYVDQKLFLKALVLEDSEGNKGVIVTSDLIGFKAEVAEPVIDRIAEKTSVARDRILLNSSHIHTGPSVSLSPRYEPKERAEATKRYTQSLMEKTAAAVGKALETMEPANLSMGVGVATFVMNRREFTPRGVVLGFNPRGFVDRSVPVLRVDGADKQMRAVLFGCACHNTTLSGKHYFVSGDFSGYAQQYLQDKFDAEPMFMTGCAGSANPHPRGSLEIARVHGQSLGQEVERILESSLRPITGPLTVAQAKVALPLEAAPSDDELAEYAKKGGRWRRFVADAVRKRRADGEELPDSYVCPISVWQFGDSLTLVALPGEVVGEYVPLIEKALGQRKLWISAYNNDVFGYIPVAATLAEGGYETRGLYSGGVGIFAPEVETVLVDAVRQLAKQAGRPEE